MCLKCCYTVSKPELENDKAIISVPELVVFQVLFVRYDVLLPTAVGAAPVNFK